MGFEIFDRTAFGQTEFLEHVNYRRALEGEIARTISTISEVSSARLHIAMAKDSLFGAREQPAKASVILKLRNPGRPLAPATVTGITNLVAASVEGLRPEAVVVMDSFGRPLARPPADDEARRALAFDPRFHDTERLVGALTPAMVPHRELNAVSELIQRSVQVSDALHAYVLALWRASAAPHEFGVDLPDLDSAQLMLAGASPRGMSLLLRAARVAAWLEQRLYVTPEDVQSVFAEAIGHRLCFQPVHELQRHLIAPRLLAAIAARVPAP